MHRRILLGHPQSTPFVRPLDGIALYTMAGHSTTAAILVKLAAISIRIVPFPLVIIRIVSHLAVSVLILDLKNWRNIVRFFDHIGGSCPRWKSVYKYYQEHSFSKIWCFMLYEVPSLWGNDVSMRELEPLKDVIGSGKGAILLGSHYGPWIASFLLAKANIASRPYVSKHMAKYMEKRSRATLLNRDSLGFLRPTYHRFTGGLDYISTGSEREMIQYLKDGGIIIFYNDTIFFERDTFVPFVFLGVQARFSAFPFRVALKYDVPILYFNTIKLQSGAYQLKVVEFKAFSSPSEGLGQYVSYLERDILENPYPWGFLKELGGKLREG